MSFQIIAITDDEGVLLDEAVLLDFLPIHQELRPNLPSEKAAYLQTMQRVFKGGARMSALLGEEKTPYALAVWRIVENTYEGRRFFIDDLVCTEKRRSSGAGRTLLAYLEEKARALSCDVLALDSGVQRARAHHFYFREGMMIPAFCFRKALT